MSLNDKLESVILKHGEGSTIMVDQPLDDDDYVPPERPPRDDDVEMDITPMIDITFLLLIFFLVTSRPDESTQVNLPQAIHGGVVSQKKATVILVKEGGIDSAPVFLVKGGGPEELPADVSARNKAIIEFINEGIEAGKDEVVVKGGRGVACRDINSVLVAVSKVKDIRINIGVLEKL